MIIASNEGVYLSSVPTPGYPPHGENGKQGPRVRENTGNLAICQNTGEKISKLTGVNRLTLGKEF